MVMLFFDTETSGLMRFSGQKRKKGYPDPGSDLDAYAGCRLVSISWLLTRRGKIVEQVYYVVDPADAFVISEDSTRIHGITQEYARQNGAPLSFVLDAFIAALDRSDTIVGHNVDFDYHVMKAELTRANRSEAVTSLDRTRRACTMLKGRQFLGVDKYPKLTELYAALFSSPMANAHDALADTMACYKCFVAMTPHDKDVFYLDTAKLRLTQEQVDVVYENEDADLMVVACAGSGKTLTMLARIQRLLECRHARDASEIMLMTFTWDAAQDMRAKLGGLLGREPDGMKIGTIDGIAKHYLENHRATSNNVGELSRDFLTLLKTCPSAVRGIRYLFVDEIQDIDETQYDIIRLLKQRCGVKLFMVGDDAQNIYGFRGSETRFMDELSKFATVKYLTVNFRSCAPIVAAANACMRRMETTRERPEMTAFVSDDDAVNRPVVMYCGTDASHQAAAVTQKVERLRRIGVPLDEIAVLCVTNRGLFRVEEELVKRGVRCTYLEKKRGERTCKTQGSLCLSTIHKAKGMEWRVVILVDMHEPRARGNPAEIEEQRRLFYVGVTRAKEALLLAYYAPSFAPSVTRFVAETRRDRVWTFKNMVDACFHARSSTGERRPGALAVSLRTALSSLRGTEYDEMRRRFPIVWLPSSSEPTVRATASGGAGAEALARLSWYACCGSKSITIDARRVLASHPPVDPQLVQIQRRYAKGRSPDVAPRDALLHAEVVATTESRAAEHGLPDAELVTLHPPSDEYPGHFLKRIRHTVRYIESNGAEEATPSQLWDLYACGQAARDQRRRLAFHPQEEYDAAFDMVRPSVDHEAIKDWCLQLRRDWSAADVPYHHPNAAILQEEPCVWAKDRASGKWDAYVVACMDEDRGDVEAYHAYFTALASVDDKDKFTDRRWCFVVDVTRRCVRGKVDLRNDTKTMDDATDFFLSTTINRT